MVPNRVAILGLGLLGGSLAKAMRAAFPRAELVCWDPNTSVTAEALSHHIVDSIETSTAQAVRSADVVVLCAPIDAFESLFKAMAPALLPGALVTDVGSTKRSVVAAAERVLPTGTRFVGSHPMAGSERQGLSASRADLFTDALCLITPTASTDPSTIESAETFWKTIGMRTRQLSPNQHDALVADASHLPHAVAAALVNIQSELSLQIAGRGFTSVTRPAGGDAGLWQGIFLDNRDHLRESLLKLRFELDVLLSGIDNNDAAAVYEWLARAAERHDS